MIGDQRSRAAVVVLMAVLITLLLGNRAHASGASGDISQLRVVGGKTQLVFSGVDLSYGQGIDPKSVRVLVDGTPVDASVVSAEHAAVRRTAILVIDRSGSMQGSGIAGARAAAHAFVGHVPADVRVGLVTFSDTANLIIAPTTDRRALNKAIDGVAAAGNTSLYDALELALKTAGAVGQRRLVLLSDGADTRSRTTLAATLKQLAHAGVPVDAVGFNTATGSGSVLSQLTDAATGHVYAATDALGLNAAFTTAAAAFTSQLVVTFTMPAADAGKRVSVHVKAKAGDTVIEDATAYDVPGGPSKAGHKTQVATILPVHGSRILRDIGVVAIFLSVLLLAVLALDGRLGTTRRRREMGRLLSRYSVRGQSAEADAKEPEGHGQVAQSALDLSERVLRARGWEASLSRRLDAAGLKVRPNEWALLQFGFGAVTLLFMVLGGFNLLLALAGAIVLALALPLLFLSFKASRRRAKFLDDLPDTLQVIAGSLTTGYSLDQAIDAMLTEAREPIAGEFSRAVSASRLGLPLEDALQACAERLQIEEFDWVVMAINVQRQVGGSLAEVLRTVALTIRERQKLKRQVRVLTAEGRLSGYVLVALPIALGAFFFAFERSYFRTMYTTMVGLAMLGVSAVMIVIGWVWMRKLAKVDV